MSTLRGGGTVDIRRSALLVLVFALTPLAACGGGDEGREAAVDVVGTWNVFTASGSPVSPTTFSADGTYVIGSSESPVDKGTYELAGETLVFVTTVDGACAEGDRGDYTVSDAADGWTLAAVEDECSYRPQGGPFSFLP